MVIKSIHSRAPTRIDLAGGTIDIWPLYLFLKDPVTLNLGIDLYAEATLDLTSTSDSPENQVTLRSNDQNTELQFSWKSIQSGLTPPPSLELHFKLLKYFFEMAVRKGADPTKNNLALSTRARSPAGAGLGGSSTLSVAMIGALAKWTALLCGEQIDPKDQGNQLIEIVRDIETTVIQVPAGLQDYFGAMYGGLQTLHWGIGTHSRDPLPSDLIPELEQRLLLFYSGQSRNSGINNWALFKGFIDRQDQIRSKFEQISSVTHQLTAALKKRQWADAAALIAKEWEVRKSLAPGITTPEIDQAFEKARQIAPVSGKVCGAGGGGCFFVYLPFESKLSTSDISTKEKIREIFVQHGMRSLDFHGVPHGLEVRVTEE
jgi:D-glycero-alpha-D-manno-heptose-7-phosphate kinase